ncbi:MAG: hypothetical protein N2322_05335, partial [Terrimicrobiaceae bacterium]|nr:hypothetical protein [Terrimicrobiaceae bacterium]
MNTLDPSFIPFLRTVESRQPGDEPVAITLHGEQGRLSTFRTHASPGGQARLSRIVKFLLWARGGWRIELRGAAWAAEALAAEYGPGGPRAFDAELMEKVYG